MPQPPAATDRRREFALIPPLIVGGAGFMQAFDTQAVTVALPAMAEAFQVEPLALNMVISAYLIGATALLPLCNWAAERFGARAMFTFAIALFGLSALVCGLSTNLTSLILARIVQGAAGALLLPVGRIIVLGTAAKQDFVRAMAVLTTPVMLGPLIGPPLGGAIVTVASWRWLFLINVPIALAGVVLVLRFLPVVPAGRVRPLDWRGLVLISTALVAISYGVSLTTRPTAPTTVAAIVVLGAVCGLAYLHHARRHPHPVLALGVLRVPTVALTNIGGTFHRMLTSAAPFLLTLLFQVGFDLSPLAAGGLIFGSALGSIAARWPLALILRRWGFRTMLTTNAVAIAATLSLPALFQADTHYLLMFGVLFVQGMLRSLQITALTPLVYADIEERDFGAASTISSVAQQLALSFGIAASVLTVQAMQAWRSEATLGAGAIRPAFVILALISLLSLIWIRRLPRDAGSVIAGHSEAQRLGMTR